MNSVFGVPAGNYIYTKANGERFNVTISEPKVTYPEGYQPNTGHKETTMMFMKRNIHALCAIIYINVFAAVGSYCYNRNRTTSYSRLEHVLYCSALVVSAYACMLIAVKVFSPAVLMSGGFASYMTHRVENMNRSAANMNHRVEEQRRQTPPATPRIEVID